MGEEAKAVGIIFFVITIILAFASISTVNSYTETVLQEQSAYLGGIFIMLFAILTLMISMTGFLMSETNPKGK